MKKRFILAALLLSTASAAQAVVVVEERDGSAGSLGSFYWGVSFTTPTGSPWNNISVNFYDTGNNNLAGGNGYLFTSAYTGSAIGLASAGALATATSAANQWNFASGFQINPLTQYFFYSDAPLAPLLGDDIAPGESYFVSSSPTRNFTPTSGRNINYTVNSMNGAVPEPATWALMLIGFGAIGAAMRRRQLQTVRFNFA